jgi:hypothetical protein
MELAEASRHDTEGEQGRLAVLIDADNAHAAIVEALLAEIARFGVASVKRIYGDWTQPQLGSWKKVLLQHSIVPVQQFGYTKGKNATDSALIIDAMDLLYTRRFDGFCLVSSDSDFTRLASRLREEGLLVYGFGERKTPSPFVSACDKFIYTELLRPDKSQQPGHAAAATGLPTSNAPAMQGERAGPGRAKTSARSAATPNTAIARDSVRTDSAWRPGASADANPASANPAPAPADSTGSTSGVPENEAGIVKGSRTRTSAESDATTTTDASTDVTTDTEDLGHEDTQPPVELIAHAIDTVSDDSGWASLGAVGRTLTKLRPDFDSRLYGYRKFSELVRALPERFETEERSTGSGKTIFVRLAPRVARKAPSKRTRSSASSRKRATPAAET